MESNEIISLVICKLKDEDLWFTQKTDPTWGNPSHYYKLDEYGEPVESAVKEIVKEVNSYIGDGAVGIEDAIDIWVQEALADYRIAYSSSLVTKFKDKPVVDGIEAYTSQVMKENKEISNLNEVSEYVSKYDELDNLLNVYIVDDESKIDLYNYFNNDEIDNLENDNEQKYDNWLDEMKENNFDELMEYLKEKDDDTTYLIDKIGENKLIKNEDYKRRLKEENNKSANLISQMFQADDFDSDSKAGQIVMRTSELFNALSDKGYDVQVAFDNGESTNTILLGQQGGQVVITITDTNQPLRAFSSGNFEINDDNLQILTDESCNFRFYENCGCGKVYETIVKNQEYDKLGSISSERAFIYEKK